LLLDLVAKPLILVGAGDDRDVGVVLGGPSDQAWSADVDVLDGLFEADVGSGDGGLERVEVDDHEVDRLDPLGFEGLKIFGNIATGENSAVELRVECLDPAAEDLRLAGVGGDLDGIDPRSDERCSRPARGEKLDPLSRQKPGEFDEFALVGDAEQGPTDGNDLIHVLGLIKGAPIVGWVETQLLVGKSWVTTQPTN
jgi:hypothetical protein